MKPAIERARLLIKQNRFQLAAEELTRVLAEDPEDPLALVLFAESLSYLKRHDEACTNARRAVHLAPDWDLAHYVLGVALWRADEDKKALVHAREAIRLDPEDADHFALAAAIHESLYDWKAALAAADEGLARDPENVGCLNRRTTALTKLGRRDEAVRTSKGALHLNPESSASHANLGWTLLHQGKRQEAMHHFREALRIDPQNSWARGGMVEALKAGNPIYGMMLRYFLWMSSFSRRTQLALIFGALFGYTLLGSVMAGSPALAPLAGLLALIYLSFVFLTWLADPCFNLMLRLHPVGKHALFRHQIRAANWFGAGVLICVAFLVLLQIPLGAAPSIQTWILPFFLLFPVHIFSLARPGWPKLAAGGVALAALALLFTSLVLPGLLGFFLLITVASTWAGNFWPRAEEEWE